jgi:hypothetical protein
VLSLTIGGNTYNQTELLNIFDEQGKMVRHMVGVGSCVGPLCTLLLRHM